MRWYLVFTSLFIMLVVSSTSRADGKQVASTDLNPTLDSSLYGTPELLTAETPSPRSRESGRRWLALTINPIAPLIGRWGGNIELLPKAHHGIVLSGSYVSRADCCTSDPSGAAGTNPNNSGLLRGGFGELGYRYYTSSHGPAGLFIGPSLVTGVLATGSEGTLSLVGGALDVGGQFIFHGFVFGAGAGVQALHASKVIAKTDDPTVDVLTQSMIAPRVLASIGYAL
jgi:hypothetical protein